MPILLIVLLIFTQTLAKGVESSKKQRSIKGASETKKTVGEVKSTQNEAQSNKTNAAHDIGEEIISGQAQLQIDDQKIYTTPLIDPFGPLNDLLKSDLYVFDNKLYEDIDKLTIPNQLLHSSYLRLPVEQEFIKGDVLVFLPKFETKVAKWELIISNSLGETVRKLSGSGDPAALISWDGRTDNGEMVITGEVYNFTFYAYDALGNQTRITGKPQRISGIVYQGKMEWIITIAGDILFARSTAEYVEGARHRIEEAINLIKEKFKSELVVYVYTENELLSTARCDIFKKEILSRMVLPKEALAIVPRFIPGLQPKYSKIEIHIR
ncbi:MAG: hypothetical protein ACETVX_05480 [bacterium]|nr:hypothetical protein [candidate division WOR-3 bacterium]MDH5683160.1 hypothetical protein [candidate division WOR-3 bacterium]